jgi:transposase InsO family protein
VRLGYRYLSLKAAAWDEDTNIFPEQFRIAIDDFNREALSIEVDFSLPAERVIRTLDRVIEWRGKPQALRCDNGPEYISATSQSRQKWGDYHGNLL